MWQSSFPELPYLVATGCQHSSTLFCTRATIPVLSRPMETKKCHLFIYISSGQKKKQFKKITLAAPTINFCFMHMKQESMFLSEQTLTSTAVSVTVVCLLVWTAGACLDFFSVSKSFWNLDCVTLFTTFPSFSLFTYCRYWPPQTGTQYSIKFQSCFDPVIYSSLQWSPATSQFDFCGFTTMWIFPQTFLKIKYNSTLAGIFCFFVCVRFLSCDLIGHASSLGILVSTLLHLAASIPTVVCIFRCSTL